MKPSFDEAKQETLREKKSGK